MHPYGSWITTCLFSEFMEIRDAVLNWAVARDSHGHPAIAESGHTAQGRWLSATDPYRNRAALGRFGFHGHVIYLVVLAGKCHMLIAPVGPEQLNRFIQALATGAEVLVQSLVFGPLPANSHAQAYAAT